MSGGIIVNGAALRHVRQHMYGQAGEDVTKPLRIPSGIVLACEESRVEDVLCCARDELARQRSYLAEATKTPRQRKQIRKVIVRLKNDLDELACG
jgi:hypothetical protein